MSLWEKTPRQKAKIFIFITAAAIGATVFFSMAFAAYKTRGINSVYINTPEECTPEDSPESTTVPILTASPSPTPRKPFIPDPDELQPLPVIDEIEMNDTAITGKIIDNTLSVFWEIIDNADYYVFCAVNAEDKIYQKEILWADIAEWLVPDVQQGNIYLFCYEDMGEDSSEDDEMIAAFSYNVIIENESPEPTATKKPDNDDSDSVKNKYYIIVDKEDFTFAIFTYDENGDYTILVKAFPTAIGRSDRMTPDGTFEISSKGAWKNWSSGSFSPYYTRFTSGLYFHGSVYKEMSGDSMYKSFYNEIGTAASSGCLRTTFEAAKWVYVNCPAGTVVKIVSSSEMVDRVIKPALDPAYPTWDPTDPEKPSLNPPAVITNSLLRINENGSLSLKEFLSAVDERVENDTLIYEVLTPPQHGALSKTIFTQKELGNDEIIYTHDGTETEIDSFRFTVTNLSSKTGVITFNISITLLDDTPPEILINQFIEVENGSTHSLASHLLAEDDEAPSDDLIYTVTEMPEHGSIPYSFTQAELLSGDIVYIHDGSDSTTDSFIFSVSDGVNVLEGQMFSISILSSSEDSYQEPAEEPSPSPDSFAGS